MLFVGEERKVRERVKREREGKGVSSRQEIELISQNLRQQPVMHACHLLATASSRSCQLYSSTVPH